MSGPRLNSATLSRSGARAVAEGRGRDQRYAGLYAGSAVLGAKPPPRPWSAAAGLLGGVGWPGRAGGTAFKARGRGLVVGPLMVALAETRLSAGDLLTHLDHQQKDTARLALRAAPDLPARRVERIHHGRGDDRRRLPYAGGAVGPSRAGRGAVSERVVQQPSASAHREPEMVG